MRWQVPGCPLLIVMFAVTVVMPPLGGSGSAEARSPRAAKVTKGKPKRAPPKVAAPEPLAKLRPAFDADVPLPPRKPQTVAAGDKGRLASKAGGKRGRKVPSDAVEQESLSVDAAAKAEAQPVPAPADATAADIAAAKLRCGELLNQIAIEFRYLPPLKDGACGTTQPIEVSSIGNKPKVLLSPPATMNCPLAAALARWVGDTLQPLALREFETAIVELQNGTSYACRNRNGDASGKLSEHAFANALDIPSFKLADGQRIVVASGWGPVSRDVAAASADAVAPELAGVTVDEPMTEGDNAVPLPPRKSLGPRVVKTRLVKIGELAAGADRARSELGGPRQSAKEKPAKVGKRRKSQIEARKAWPQPSTATARFLHAAHDAACTVFGTVLGPEANNAHRDHLHVDLAPRKRSAFCE